MMIRFFAFLFVFVVGVFLMPTFDASAGVVDYVDLTPAQTLALYGSTISGTYWNGSEYDSCTFTYCYTFEPSALNQVICKPSVKWSDTDKNYMQERKYLIYEMDADGVVTNDVISFDDSRITVTLTPSISISGIAYFRQFLGFSYDGNSTSRQRLNPDYNFVSDSFSYSPSPVTFTPKHNDIYNNLYVTNFVELGIPFDAIGSPAQSDSGIVPTNCQIYFSVFDCMGQNLVDGIEQTFNFTGQTFSYNRTTSYGWETSSLRDHHYFIMVSCPRLTDGYVIDQPETTPNYGGQLDDINVSIGSTNTLLQQILAKLDAIYAKMNSQGISISGTVEIGGPSITNIGVAIGNSVGAAIQSLFVPSQADILNFRLGMNTLVADTFAPFEDAESVRDEAFRRIVSASPTATLDLPLMDLRSAGVDFYIPPETFTNQGYIVQDNKVKVPLMPREEEWGSIYELLKWLIDIVCTTAFLNMLLNKFHGIIVGKKVVEIEDDC